MLGNSCKNWGEFEWRPEALDTRHWEVLRPSSNLTRQPTKAYSKRSACLADLREKYEWANSNADDLIQPASEEAFFAAKDFINNLPEGCLDFRLAFSQSGEINFFFGSGEDLFQILIDAVGTISYYAHSRDEAFGMSEITVRAFPYMRLLQFCERNK